MPKLRLGDDNQVILLLQQTQTDPHKAIAELVENSIDARAKHVVILRSRKDGRVCITVTDDGEGVKPDPKGLPDVDFIAQNIADSAKRKIPSDQKKLVQGQFGIGLLGFSAVGEELLLSSRRETTPTRSIRLRASSDDYDPDVHSADLRAQGTEVEIRGVHREVQARLTGEKLQRYLSEELRDRIRSSGVQISIEDRVGARKRLEVRPREFSGSPLTSGSKVVDTELGQIRLELFVTFPKEGDRAKVAIARRGTRLLADVLEVEELKRPPWNLNCLEGLIDFEGLHPAPATRRGFLPDASYDVFLREIRKLEPGITLELETHRKRNEAQLTREALEKLQKAFAEAMEELPDDYGWFDDAGSDLPAPGRPSSKTGGMRREIRVSLNGPLAEVRVNPKIAVIGPSEIRRLVARAFDPTGAVILSGVSFEWSVAADSKSLVALTSEGPVAAVEAKVKEGEATLRVRGQFRGKEAWGLAKVVITKSEMQFRFPPPQKVNSPGEPWRSRYRSDLGVLEYNSGHRDYERAAEVGATGRLKYISKLYAKELVLLNFSGIAAPQLLERMVELTSMLERKL